MGDAIQRLGSNRHVLTEATGKVEHGEGRIRALVAAVDRDARWRPIGYWLATILVVSELGLGGIWDVARIPYVRELVIHLGYPTYFLVVLGVWKLLGAAALLVPRRALLKEWAYAGVIFVYTGAIASHLATGYKLGELGVLTTFTVLTALSWALRPSSRRLWPALHRTTKVASVAIDGSRL
jgi:uncharacterized membrane protein YphA (DoxX/SURF4 family)